MVPLFHRWILASLIDRSWLAAVLTSVGRQFYRWTPEATPLHAPPLVRLLSSMPTSMRGKEERKNDVKGKERKYTKNISLRFFFLSKTYLLH